MAAIDISLDDAIELQKQNTKNKQCKIIILSDCQEAIRAAQEPNRPTIYSDCKFNINESISELEDLGAEVIFDWVPGHSSTQGNDIADELAKNELRNMRGEDTENVYEVSRNAMKTTVDAVFNGVWQDWWNNWSDTRSYKIMGKVGTPSPLRHGGEMTRREQTVLTRLRVGNATHNGRLHITKRTDSPKCQCGIEDSAEHRIFECGEYSSEREELLNVLDKHGVQHNLVDMMKLDNGSKEATNEIITTLLKFLNSTNLISLFLWNPRDEEFGVEGYVLMKQPAKTWADPQDD
jgi:hypothetical protein